MDDVINDVVLNGCGNYCNGPHEHAHDMLFIPLEGQFVVGSSGSGSATLGRGSVWLVPRQFSHQVAATPQQQHLCYYIDLEKLLTQLGMPFTEEHNRPRLWSASNLLLDSLTMREHARLHRGRLRISIEQIDQIALQEAARTLDAARRFGREEKNALITAIVMHIDRNLHDDLSIHQISERFGISERTLARRFVNEIKSPIGSYILSRRLEEARRLLQGTDMPIGEIQLSVGFSSASHFATSIRRRFNMSPSALRG